MMTLRNGKVLTAVPTLPNDLIIKIIEDASTQYGGRLWSIHQKKFKSTLARVRFVGTQLSS